MRFAYRVLVAALAVSSCAPQDSGREAPFEFGKLRANLNGSEFAGIFGRDSILAMWDTSAGQMQIEGDKRSRGRRPEIVRFTMRCGVLPRPGTYAIRNPFSPVSAEAFAEPTRWQRIWPLHGEKYRAFLSESMPPGRLVLDAVDSANALIKGHFNVSLRSVNRTPAETLHVRGTFLGRLDLQQHFPRPRRRWAPLFQTDCERIRDAVSM